MAQIQELKVETRDGTGKGPAFQAPGKGRPPATVSGGPANPENVAVGARSVERHVARGRFLATLLMPDVGGKKPRVIRREVQLGPVSGGPGHVDFMRRVDGAPVRVD